MGPLYNKKLANCSIKGILAIVTTISSDNEKNTDNSNYDSLKLLVKDYVFIIWIF